MDIACISDLFSDLMTDAEKRNLTAQECEAICNDPCMDELLLGAAMKTFQKTNASGWFFRETRLHRLDRRTLVLIEKDRHRRINWEDDVLPTVNRIRDNLITYAHTTGMRRLYYQRSKMDVRSRLDWHAGPYVSISLLGAVVLKLMWVTRDSSSGEEEDATTTTTKFRPLFPDPDTDISDHPDYAIWHKRRLDIACKSINLAHVTTDGNALVDYSDEYDNVGYLFFLLTRLAGQDADYEFSDVIIYPQRRGKRSHLLFNRRYQHRTRGVQLYFVDKTTGQVRMPNSEATSTFFSAQWSDPEDVKAVMDYTKQCAKAFFDGSAWSRQ